MLPDINPAVFYINLSDFKLFRSRQADGLLATLAPNLINRNPGGELQTFPKFLLWRDWKLSEAHVPDFSKVLPVAESGQNRSPQPAFYRRDKIAAKFPLAARLR